MMEHLTSLFDERGLRSALLPLIDDAAGGGVFVAFALLTAAVIGSIHAVGPGHGKALIGAYLIGSGGRRRDALALGGLVAVMHTGSVLALGITLHATQRIPGGARVESLLTLASAAAIVAVGVGLLLRRSRPRRRATGPVPVAVAVRTGAAGGDDPAGAHPHDRAHADHHVLPEGVPPLSRAGVVALATSGGLLPSPAAFLVLATAMAMGRTLFGLALVAAFSLGLAVTLTGLGFAVLWGRDALGERAAAWPALARIVRVAPAVAAGAVVVGGIVLGVAAVLRW